MIILKESDYDKILTQASRELPNECCGMLAGKIEDETIAITEVYPMYNVDQSPEHFSLDPEEQFKVLKDLRSKGYKLVGNYHSHPNSPARPSTEDIRLAYDANIIYMILSLEREQPDIKAFRIIDGTVSQVPITII